MIFSMADAAMLLLGVPASLVARASIQTFGPEAFARVFAGLAVLMVPYLVGQLWQSAPRRRGVTQLACLALALDGLVWLFLAYSVAGLHLGWTPLVFARNGIGALLVSVVLAYSLNAEQLRVLLERPQ
jgi:hypothetical protein